MEPHLETDTSFSGPLKPVLEERLPWLFDEFGFRVVSNEYYPEAFGNSVVMLQSGALRLRFTADRRQIFASLAPLPEPECWCGLATLRTALRGETAKLGLTLDTVAAALRTELPALTTALGSEWPSFRPKVERYLERPLSERAAAIKARQRAARTR